MKGKLLFVSGAALGYVLGTRAGRKRYEQIKEAAAGIWNTPTVQRGVDQAKDFALARVSTVSDAMFDGAKKLVNAATKQNTAKPAQPTPVPVTPTPVPVTPPAGPTPTMPSSSSSND